MAKDTNLKIQGADELRKILKRLPNEILGKALQAGIRESGKLVRDDAKQRIKSHNLLDKGNLYNNTLTKKGPGGLTEVQQYVYVKNKSFYGYFWEKGFMRKARGQGKKKQGRARGGKRNLYREPAKPFMRPALDENRYSIIKVFSDKINQFIKRKAIRARMK